MLNYPRRVLITGGAGFIGSHLVDRMLQNNHRVLCLDNFDNNYHPDIKKNNLALHRNNPLLAVEEIDIRHKLKIDQICSTFKPEIIIHLAAQVGVRPSVEKPLLYESVNIRGTLNMLHAAIDNKAQKFIFASSSSVYGINHKVPFAEDDPCHKPISPYAATKIAGEALCHAMAHIHNLPVVTLRFFTVYGPRQRPDLAIHKFTRHIFEGLPLPVYGDGSTSRDYTYIDDIIDGIWAAIGHTPQPFAVFNLGNSETIKLMELINLLEQLTRRKATILHQQQQPGDVPRTWANLTKARHYLNYNPATPLPQGIANFLQWYQKTMMTTDSVR